MQNPKSFGINHVEIPVFARPEELPRIFDMNPFQVLGNLNVPGVGLPISPLESSTGLFQENHRKLLGNVNGTPWNLGPAIIGVPNENLRGKVQHFRCGPF
eukprot:6490295-Amphidinium_carterae.1